MKKENITNRLELFVETGRDPSPEHAIPPQRLPKSIRRTLQIMIYPFMMLDLFTQKVAKMIIRPPYKRVGKCKRRGNCCKYILMKKPKGLFGKLYYLWYTEVNGFYYRGEHKEDGQEICALGCRHLKKDGSCGQYRLRPLICRNWPVIEHFGKPRILKGCGYDVELRK